MPQLPDEMETHAEDITALTSKSLAAEAVSAVPQAPSQLPEVEAYACWLTLLHLTDLKKWEAVSAVVLNLSTYMLVIVTLLLQSSHNNLCVLIEGI